MDLCQWDSDVTGATGTQSKKAAKNAKGLSGSLDAMTAAAGAYLSIAAAIKALKMADEWIVLQERIKTATKATGDYTVVAQELYRITVDNGTAMADTVATFQRLSIARAELQATNAEILTVTSSVQQLGRMSGASGTSMQAGMLQFSQAMSAGVVRAEELNSIIENMPAVAERIARGMEMTVGELRLAVLEGKVLSRDVFDSLLEQAGGISKEFESIPSNLSTATNMLTSAFTKLLSQMDQATGAVSWLVFLMEKTARGMDVAGSYIAPEGLAKYNDLLTQRLKLEGDISSLEQKSGSGDAVLHLKEQLQAINEQIKAMSDEKIAFLGGNGSVGDSTPAIASQKDLSKQIKDVNGLLKDQDRLFDQQAAAVQKAQARTQVLKSGYDAARQEVWSSGQPGAAPDIIGVSSDLLQAESLSAAGNYEAAILAAEKAKGVILEMKAAGAESDIVLQGLLLRAEEAGVGAAKSIEGARQAELDKTKSVITDLLAKAEQLKALKVGFDATGALAEAAILRATIQDEFNQHPLTMPVTTSLIGADGPQAPTGASPTHARFANVPPIMGAAPAVAAEPGEDHVIRYKVEVDTSTVDDAVRSASEQAQAAADAEGPVIIRSTVDGVPTFSDGKDSLNQALAAEVMMRGTP